MGYMGKHHTKGLILIGLVCAWLNSWGQVPFHTYEDRVFTFDGSYPFQQADNVIQDEQLGGLTFLTPGIDAQALSNPIPLSSKSPSDHTALAGELAFSGQGEFMLSIQFGNPSTNVWLDAQELRRCQPYGDELGQWRSDLVFVPDGMTHYRFLIRIPAPNSGTSLAISHLVWHKVKINGLPQPDTVSTILQGTPQACEGCLPEYYPREAWGAPDPDSQRHTCSQPLYAPISHMIVQHSATDNTYSNWAAVMLALWNYDVEVLGGCDLAYNWYIDPLGRVYEGRGGGYEVVGDYFCGNEVGTVGICMLGTYETQEPTGEALQSLRRLLAWQACAAEIDPMANKQLITGPLSGPIPVISTLSVGCQDVSQPFQIAQELPGLRSYVEQKLADPGACLVSISETPGQVLPFTLYPNPTQGQVIIRMQADKPQLAEQTLLDVQGRVLMRSTFRLTAGRQEIPLDLSQWATGLYYVRVKTAEMQQTSLLHIAK